MVNPLTRIDYGLLKILNVDLGSTTADEFWLVVTHLDRYWPTKVAVLLLLGWGFYVFRLSFLRLLGVLGVCVGLTDVLCYRVIKHLVERPRPFLNLELVEWLRHVGDAHGPSFPSNHAANTMAGAVVLSVYFKSWRYFFYSFAVLVALSRCALGVHYPTDVLAGGLIGYLVSRVITDLLFTRARKYVALIRFQKAPSADSETVKPVS